MAQVWLTITEKLGKSAKSVLLKAHTDLVFKAQA
jgi:hypothetical protein